MLYACVEKFKMMVGRGNILDWDEEVNKALIALSTVERHSDYDVDVMSTSV
jgi:hypothetical protein